MVIEIIASYFPYGLKIMSRNTLSAPQPDSASYYSHILQKLHDLNKYFHSKLLKTSDWLPLQDMSYNIPKFTYLINKKEHLTPSKA